MSRRSTRFIAWVCAASLSTVWSAAALGQSPAATGEHAKRELSIKVVTSGAASEPEPVGEPEFVRKVSTASAFAAVVSDVAGVLVVAHAPQPTYTQVLPEQFPITDDADLSVFRLDAQGEVGAATPIRLPRDPKLADRRHYPLAVAVHPKLPLLYVWQDVVSPATKAGAKNEPSVDPAAAGFKHLHIYDLAANPPKLVQSACSGESFSLGNSAAGIAVDRRGSRLFLPNLRRKVKTGLASMIGYIQLTADGLPADDTPAAYEAAAKTTLYGETPCGLGYYDVSDGVTIVCAGLGPCTWDEGNRRGQLNMLTFFPSVGAGYRYRMAVHPTSSTVYLTGLGSSNVYRVEHVDGYFTMWPQRGQLDGLLITSPPVVVDKRPLVACSSVGKLHLVKLDADGYFTGERTDVALTSRKVEALAYSAKYDRLYATYEEVKK